MPPKRHAYTPALQLEMLKFLAQKCKDRSSVARDPKGLRLWQAFRNYSGCAQSADSLSSHFRKQLYEHIDESELSLEQIMTIYKHTEYQVQPYQKNYLEKKYHCEILLRDRDLTVRGFRKRTEDSQDDEEEKQPDDSIDIDDSSSVSPGRNTKKRQLNTSVSAPNSPSSGLVSSMRKTRATVRQLHPMTEYNRGKSLDRTVDLTVQVNSELEKWREREKVRSRENTESPAKERSSLRRRSPIQFGLSKYTPEVLPDVWDDETDDDDFVPTKKKPKRVSAGSMSKRVEEFDKRKKELVGVQRQQSSSSTRRPATRRSPRTGFLFAASQRRKEKSTSPVKVTFNVLSGDEEEEEEERQKKDKTHDPESTAAILARIRPSSAMSLALTPAPKKKGEREKKRSNSIRIGNSVKFHVLPLDEDKKKEQKRGESLVNILKTITSGRKHDHVLVGDGGWALCKKCPMWLEELVKTVILPGERDTARRALDEKMYLESISELAKIYRDAYESIINFIEPV